jgi:MFS transporter, OFA family, oxalate/formate antiporter
MSKQGIRVVVACAGINLMLGVLYCWHVARSALVAELVQGGATTWNPAAFTDLYWVMCLTFAFSMILAGRLQDEVGPRTAAFFGSILVSLGFLLVALTRSYVAWFVGFGVFVGLGLGVIYATTTPTALRWIPRSRTGLAAGAVVATSGLAALWVLPLAVWLIDVRGVQDMMLILGTGFFVVVALLAQLLAVPATRPALFANVADDGIGIGRLVRSPQVWWLWATFLAGAGTGVMAAGLLAELAKGAVVTMAVAGAGGRVVIGAISDRHGRERTLTATLAAQAVLMLIAGLVAGEGALRAVVALSLLGLISFLYGGYLALFPAFIRDRFGLRNFGQNYGVVFTAWGLGGFVMSRLAAALKAATGTYRPAYLLACVILLVGCGLSRRLRRGAHFVQKGVPPVEGLTRSETLVAPNADSM